MSKDEKLNNARLKTFGGYVPVYSIKCVDAKQQIYRGTQLVEPERREEVMPSIVFHRNYYPELNDFDKIYKEIELDESWIGVKLFLVPKEKLLFGYMDSPKFGIMLPKPKKVQRGQM